MLYGHSRTHVPPLFGLNTPLSFALKPHLDRDYVAESLKTALFTPKRTSSLVH